MTASKRYEQEEFESKGLPGEMAIVHFLKRQLGANSVVHQPFGEYDIDVICLLESGGIGQVEVETRAASTWNGDKFRYPTIHVPVRKRAILSRPDVEFASVREDLQRAWVCRAADVVKAPVVTVPNVKVPEGEEFFDVDVKLGEYIDLGE